MRFNVNKVASLCNATILNGYPQKEFTKFCIDSRLVNSGDIYVAIRGETNDGNKYIAHAFSKGAIGCITDAYPTSEFVKSFADKIIIYVENTITALQQIASYVRNQYSIPVIAVTGSVGKTSTKDILANVIGEKYTVLKTEGNFNNHIGLPLTILNLDHQEALVVEMGMNHFGEISLLSKIAKPTIAVITNVGTSHIGNLGSRENILKAKLEILDGMGENGILIINNDNDLLHNWYENNGKQISQKIYTYGINNSSNFTATNIKRSDLFSDFNIGATTIRVNVSGEHFIYNSLAAYTVGKILDIDDENIKNGISGFQLTSKRMEIRKISNNSLIIEDYYNASFESTCMALDVLSKLDSNFKIAVLGDILELGEFANEIHSKLGDEIIKNNIDVLITVGNYSKNTANRAISLGHKKTYPCEKNFQAINILKELIKNNSAILLKASHGMNFGEIAKEIN